MYLRLTIFPLQPGNRPQIEAILAPLHALVAAQPGFRDLVLAFDAAATQLVALTLWESHADAEAVTRTVREAAQRDLGELLAGPPTSEIFEVFVPA
jgi:heme-degrading monooxygenase HmoA